MVWCNPFMCYTVERGGTFVNNKLDELTLESQVMVSIECAIYMNDRYDPEHMAWVKAPH